jgi:pimeloyl-ACP methyl ester carboxylesterase
MKYLYLHGFASGKDSKKGVALAKHFAARGLALERLDLRVPSLEHLRLSSMMEKVRDAIGGAEDRAIVLGSSLGGLTAARVAERDPRVVSLVLLAPAFQLAARWSERVGEAAWRAWEESGWLEVEDHTTGGRARVDFEFTRDVARIDTTPFPEVRVPTLIVHGTHDEVVDVGLSRTYAGSRPNVRLVEVDDGHELVASLGRICSEIDDFLP